jgi:hypothetical protein
MEQLKTYFKSHGRIYGSIYTVVYTIMLTYSVLFFFAYPAPDTALMVITWASAIMQAMLLFMTLITNIKEHYVSGKLLLSALIVSHLVKNISIVADCLIIGTDWVRVTYIIAIALLSLLLLAVRFVMIDSMVRNAQERIGTRNG